MVALLLMIGGIAFPIWLARRGASQRGVFFALAFVALLLGFACNSLSRSSLEEINSSDVSQRLGAELLRDSGTYFIAGYIGLFIGGVIAGLIWRSSADPKVDTLRPCPYCAEFIQPAAKVCKHCHREVSPHIVAEEAPTLTSLSAAKEVSDRRTSRFLIWAIAGFLLLLFLNGLRSKPSTSLTVAPVLHASLDGFDAIRLSYGVRIVNNSNDEWTRVSVRIWPSYSGTDAYEWDTNATIEAHSSQMILLRDFLSSGKRFPAESHAPVRLNASAIVKGELRTSSGAW